MHTNIETVVPQQYLQTKAELDTLTIPELKDRISKLQDNNYRRVKVQTIFVGAEGIQKTVLTDLTNPDTWPGGLISGEFVISVTGEIEDDSEDFKDFLLNMLIYLQWVQSLKSGSLNEAAYPRKITLFLL